MAVEIGALRALLSLDSAAFEKGAKRAQASMSNLQRSLHRTGQNMQRIGTQMTTRMTLPIVAATGLMMRQSIKTAVEIERMAAVANAGTTEFQRFAAGAKDVGIEQEKLSDILKDVNDRVGDFVTTGGGPMADFFENIAPKVGVTADQFARLSGPEALQFYVSSLEKAGVSQQEMTFYMEAMASDATALIPLLRDNGEEMGRLGDRAAELGAIMDEKTIASLNRSNDALLELGQVGSALSTQLTAALAPAFEFLVQKLTAVGQWFAQISPQMQTLLVIVGALAAAIGPLLIGLGLMASGFAAVMGAVAGLNLSLITLRKLLTRTGIGAVIVAAGYLADSFFNLVESTGSVGAAFKGLGQVAAAVWQGIIDSAAAIPVALQGVWAQVRSSFGLLLSDLANAWANFLDGIAGRVQGLANIDIFGFTPFEGIAQGITEASNDARSASLRLLTETGENAATASAKFAEAGGIIKSAFAPVGKVFDDLNKTVEETADVTDNATVSTEDFNAALESLESGGAGGSGGGGGAGRAAETALSGIGDAVASVTSRMDDLREGTKTVFKDVLFEAKSFSEALSGVLNNLASKLFDTGFDSLFGIISGAMGFGGGSPAMQVALPNIMGGLPGYEGGGFTGFGARAGGMDGRGGFPAMLHPNETVIDHTKGGGGQNVHVTVSVDNNGNLRAFVDQRAQMAGQRAKNETLQAMPGAMREHDMRLG